MKRYLLKSDESGAMHHHLEECAIPKPGPGEVLVRIRACSLNYRDLLVRSGQSASGGNEAIVPLSDGAGEITARGTDVQDWNTGDRVALTFFRDWVDGPFDMAYHKAARGGSCDGVLSEYLAVPAHSLVPIPDYMTFAEAATLPCAAVTAWQALFERGRPLSENGSVLCLGTGGVSIFALQIVHAFGGRVFITSSSDDKLETCRELGASEGINYRENPDWEKEVFALTDRKGVDQVIEVGGPGTLEKSMQAVSAGGTISMIGVLTGFDPSPASLFPLVARAVDVNGIYVGSRAMFSNMLRFFAKHEIHPVIDRTFGFEELGQAYAYLESGEHLGKIVIEVAA